MKILRDYDGAVDIEDVDDCGHHPKEQPNRRGKYAEKEKTLSSPSERFIDAIIDICNNHRGRRN